MNTTILPKSVKDLFNRPKQLAYALSLVAIILVSGVLILTVMRTQSSQDVINRPKAVGLEAGCDKGDCGNCAILVNSGQLGETERCSRAKQAINCLKKVSTAGKKCSGPDDFNGIVSYVNPPIYGPGDVCQDNGPDQSCTGTTDCVSQYDFSVSYSVANSSNCASGGGGGGGGGGQTCNASSPSDVWSCYQNGINGVGKGNCAWCWSQHNGTGGGGGGGSTGTLTITASCPNGCSGLNVYIEGPTASGGRFSDTVSANSLGAWANKVTTSGSYSTKLLKGQTLLDQKSGSLAGGGSLTLALSTTTDGSCQTDSDCGNKVCVNGACVKRNKTHLECVSNSCARVSGAGSDLNGCSSVGGSCESSNCSDSSCPTGQACFDGSCKAYHLGCGSSNTCVKTEGSGDNTEGCATLNATCAASCEDVVCSTGQSCFNGSCKAYHLGCTSSNVCAKLEGPGSNTGGCSVADQWCGGEVMTQCWGKGGVNGRCMDCNGDGVINILDFSCLSCNWKKKFSLTENPSCGTEAE
jgi:hypothetical protein